MRGTGEGRARTRSISGARRPHRGHMSNPYSLEGKNAVVTGAGSGIGRAIALSFATAGARGACLDLDGEAAAATAKEAAKSGQRAIGAACDVSLEADVKAAADEALAEFKAIHVLVSGAAGRDPTGTVLDLTLAQWNAV